MATKGIIGVDAIVDQTNAEIVASCTFLHNRSQAVLGFERETVVEELTLLSSAARTATTAQAPTEVNLSAQGVRLFLNVTVAAASETLTLQIQQKDLISGGWTTLAETDTITATGLYTLSYNGPLPRSWRGRIVHSAAGSWTYSVSFVYTHGSNPDAHDKGGWHYAAEFTTAQTDTVVRAAPGADTCLYIKSIFISANAAVNVSFEQGGTDLKFKHYADGQGSGVSHTFPEPLRLAPNTSLTVTTSGAVTCFVLVQGFTAGA